MGNVEKMTSLEIAYGTALSERDGADFDTFVDRARAGAYPQARAWAPVAVAGRRFAVRYFLARRDGKVVGAALVLRPRAVGPLVAPASIVERGPVVDDIADLPDVLRALRRRVPGRVQVMPYFADDQAREVEALLARERFRVVHEFSSAHARSLRVDLTPKDLFAGKTGESLRRKIRQAEKAGATARRGTASDLAALERLYADLMRGQERSDKPRVYWDALGAMVERDERGAVFVAEHEGEAISALFVARHGPIATFVIGASGQQEKSFSKMVPSMTAAIRWAKDVGCTLFDMGGIPMEGDTDPKRTSIAQFKMDFAKTPVSLVREHARWL